MAKENMSESPVIRMAGSDGHTYAATASEWPIWTEAAQAEGVELKPFIRTKDANGEAHEISPFDAEGLRAAQERGDVRAVEGADIEPQYFSAEALKAGAGRFALGLVNPLDWLRGIGTAAGTAARGLVSGTVGLATRGLAGAVRGAESLAGDEAHKASGFIKAIGEANEALVKSVTPDLFARTGEYDGVAGAAAATEAVRGVGQMIFELKGIKALGAGMQALGASAAGAQAGTAAAFGAGKYGEMAADPNGPGGAPQQAAAVAAGTTEAVIFGLLGPLRIGKKAAEAVKPFLKATGLEVSKRVAARLGKAGAAMAGAEAARQGAEMAAGRLGQGLGSREQGLGSGGEGADNPRPQTLDPQEANGYAQSAAPLTDPSNGWAERTMTEAAEAVGTQFLVGSGFALLELAEGAAGRLSARLREALGARVRENRRVYAQALDAAARGRGRAEPTPLDRARRGRALPAEVARGEDGSVGFADGSVWREEADGSGATVTVSDGTKLDAATGEVRGWRGSAENAALAAEKLVREGKTGVAFETLEGERETVWGDGSGAEVVREADGWTRDLAEGIGLAADLREGRGGEREAVRAVGLLGEEAVRRLAGEHRRAGRGEAAGAVERGLEIAQGTTEAVRDLLDADAISGRLAWTVARALSPERLGRAWEAAQGAVAELARRVGPDELEEVVFALRKAGLEGRGSRGQGLGSRGEGLGSGDEGWIEDVVREARAKWDAEHGGVGDVLVETGPDELKTVREMEGLGSRGEGLGETDPRPYTLDPQEAKGAASSTAPLTPLLDAAAGAEGNRAVELALRPDGRGYGVAAFPEAVVEIGEDGTIVVSGVKPEMLEGEAKLAAWAAFTAKVDALAAAHGRRIEIAGADVRAILEATRWQIASEGEAAYAAARSAERGRLLERLGASGLAAGVATDRASFDAAMAKAGSSKWLDSKYEVYGCVDMETGRICLNPFTVDFDTPIHEYGHLAVEVTKRVNPALVARGLELARETARFREMADDPVYGQDGEAKRAEEVLVELIARRGEGLAKEQGLGERLKAWLAAFWASFREAAGLGGIGAREVERMTLGEIADAICAEMMSGRRFGERGEGLGSREQGLGSRGAARVEANPNLARDVAAALNMERLKGTVVPRQKVVEFSKTPPFLRSLGVPEANIISRADILRKIRREHFLTDAQIADLPNRYAQPVAVMRDGVNYVVLTDMTAPTRAGGEKPVMVYLRAANRAGRHNFIASAYAREAGKERAYTDWAKAGRVAYVDGERIAAIGLEEATVSQFKPLAKGGNTAGSIANPGGGVKGARPKASARVRAVRAYVREASGGDMLDTDTDVLGVWADRGGRLFDRLPYTVETTYAARARSGVKRTRRAVADEFAESAAFYRDLSARERKLFFGTQKLAEGPVGEGLKEALEANGVTRFTDPHDGTVDYEGVIEEFRRQWDWFERRATREAEAAEQEEARMAYWEALAEPERLDAERAEAEAASSEAEEAWRLDIAAEAFAAGDDAYAALKAGPDGWRFKREPNGRRAEEIDGVKYPVDSYGGKGVKDGEKAGWNYVSFRDDNIRVDHKWTDGAMRFKRAPNGRPSNLDERQAREVRTEAFKAWFGDWERVAELEAARDFALGGEAVARLTGGEFPKDGTSLVARVAKLFEGQGGEAVNPRLGRVALDRKGAKSSLAHGLGGAKAAAFAAVKDVIEKGAVFDRNENWKGRAYDTAVIAAPVVIGETEYVCEVVVKRAAGRNSFYLHEVNLKDALRHHVKTPTGGASIGEPARPVRSIIAKRLAERKGGEFSKVVDANGEPLVVWHGTDVAFNVFDAEYGAWFNDSREQADFYQKGFRNESPRTMAVYLNIRNPRIIDAKGHEWNDIPVPKEIREAVGDRFATSDTLAAFAHHDKAHDGLIIKNVLEQNGSRPTTDFVVYKSEQIKSATENTGAFDALNPDIRFKRGIVGGRETAVAEGYPLSLREARDPEKVLAVLSPLVGKSAAPLGEMKLTRINAKSMEHLLESREARHDRLDSSRTGKRLWRGRVGGLSVLDDIIATSPLGTREDPRHFNLEWKKSATFYRAETRFAVETEQGYEVYPCKLLVAELKNGERYVYDLVEIKEPTLSASAGRANLALPQGRTGESAALTGDSIANPGAGRQGGVAFKRGPGRAELVAGRVRVADDAGVGERTRGGVAASEELMRQGPVPLTVQGRRYLSLPLSEMRALEGFLGAGAGADATSRVPPVGGAGRTARIRIAADVRGVIDKTDMAREKAWLRERGLFKHEDFEWALGTDAAARREMREKSDEALAARLLDLAERRVRGVEAGGDAAARRVYADKLAAAVMEMPHGLRGTLGAVQTVGRALEARVKGRAAEAEAFLAWMEGREGLGSREQGLGSRGEGLGASDPKPKTLDPRPQTLDPQEANGHAQSAAPLTDPQEAKGAASSTDSSKLARRMFGAFLVMPKEMEARAKGWYDAMRTVIAGDERLSEAFRRITVRMMDEQAASFLEEDIRRASEAETERAIRRLREEGSEPIAAGGRADAAKEYAVLAFDDRMGASVVRVDARVKLYERAYKEALKACRTQAERDELKAAHDLWLGEVAQAKNQAELSRTAWERGARNADARYLYRLKALIDEATVRRGMSASDASLYMDMKRVVETQGRSGARGTSARQAQLILDRLAARLGPERYAQVEAFARNWQAVHEQEFLNDSAFARVFGADFQNLCLSQTHYVTTKRQWSAEELEGIARARKAVGRGDDVVGAMYDYCGKAAGSGATGEGLFLGRLKGSFADKQEVMSATIEKVVALKRFMRRNAYVIDLRDMLLKAGVEGVHDFARGEAAFPENARYGRLNYLEGGKRRTLVVPRLIADGFGRTAAMDRLAWKPAVLVNGAIRRMLIDWNPVYWQRNIARNVGSIEMNMPGMREAKAKVALRAAFPGLAPVTELALHHLVRHLPERSAASRAIRALWGRHTALYWAPKAKRMALWATDFDGQQRKLWAAEDRGDLGTVEEMREDLSDMLAALKGNMLVGSGAGRRGGTTDSFLDESLASVGRTMARALEEEAAKPKWKKALDAVNLFRRNAAQQDFEDVLAKFEAYLHDRAAFGAARTAEESGLAVKGNVSIAEGERRGAVARPMQAVMQPFFNMVEKGVARSVRAYRERPKEMAWKAAGRLVPRIVQGLVGSGAVAAWILARHDGDEAAAQAGPLGEVYDWARAVQRARQNCSKYVRENYHVTPLWTSADGYTSIVVGMPLTDEERVLEPMARFAADLGAWATGAKTELEAAEALKDATVGLVAPDLKAGGFLFELLDDTVHALWENPEDYYTGGTKYDPALWEARNASWGMRGAFALAMGKRLWSDFGGRAVYPVERPGADSGLGSEPGWVARALRNIPVVSPVLKSFVKVQVGSPKRDAAEITAAERRLNAVIRVHAGELLDMAKAEGRDVSEDAGRYEALLRKWAAAEGLDDEAVARIEARYLNAWNTWSGAKEGAAAEREAYRRKAERLGLDAMADVWLGFD